MIALATRFLSVKGLGKYTWFSFYKTKEGFYFSLEAFCSHDLPPCSNWELVNSAEKCGVNRCSQIANTLIIVKRMEKDKIN